ncbi:MAG: hypothetical protein AAB780_01695 [Patescibacteria group bacterium]
MKDQLVKRFVLERAKDHSGVSGTGIVAQGCEFANGKVVISWLTPMSSVSVFDSISVLEEIHGHEGSTKVVWEEGEDLEPTGCQATLLGFQCENKDRYHLSPHHVNEGTPEALVWDLEFEG